MNYYKDNNGNVFSYSDIQTPKAGLISMTPAEVQEHLNPPVDHENLAAEARVRRDAEIKSMRWRIERHDDEIRMGMTPTEPIEPLLRYVQFLRDLPTQSGFPTDIEWPEVPTY